MERTNDQHEGIKRVPTDASVAPKSCLGAFEGLVVFFCIKIVLSNGKNGHGALVGLTYKKVQVWIISKTKNGKHGFWHL